MGDPMAEEERDYYKILGVSPEASYEEIRSAFRALARELHPDTGEGGGDVRRFQLVQEAWEVLSDPERRARYDRERRRARPGPTLRRGGGRRVWAEPARYTLVVTPYEAMTGGTIEVPLQVFLECPRCEGRGRLPYAFCRDCRGRGVVRQSIVVPVQVPPGVRHNDVLQFETESPIPLTVTLHVRFAW